MAEIGVILLMFSAGLETDLKELVKGIRKKGEDSKVAIRSIRRDALEDAKTQKKNGEITEDDVKNIEKDVQKLTDNYIKEIDDIISFKEKEILEV